jgi:hypothetical protein
LEAISDTVLNFLKQYVLLSQQLSAESVMYITDSTSQLAHHR